MVSIDTEKCLGCGGCIDLCPAIAISMINDVVIIDEKLETSLRVDIGNSIILCDLNSGEESHYMLVSPREVDPTRGKISNVSPIGKAVIGKEQGETVVIEVPAGRLRYQIKRIEN